MTSLITKAPRRGYERLSHAALAPVRLARPVSRLAALLCASVAVMAGAAPAAAAQTQPDAGAQAGTQAHPYLSLAQLRARYQDGASRYMTIAGMRVHYKDEGPRTAPVLFMIHGSESSLRTWDGVARDLTAHFRVVRYDIPGFGLSDAPSSQAAATMAPEQLPLTLLDRLGIRHASVIGVSSGGTMAMFMAAARPDLVTRLILSNTPSDPVDVSHLVMPQGFLDAQARAKKTGFRDQDFWNRFLSFFAGDPARLSAQTRREYYDFYRRREDPDKLALVAKIGDGKQANIAMAKVTAPTMLIWGGADPLLPDAAADAIARHLSHARISRMIMPDVGHYPPLEVPDRFAALVSAYIEDATPDAGHNREGR